MTLSAMYLIDTNVISELRKHRRANLGVWQFFQQAAEQDTPLFISVITVGELRRGVEIVRWRGDLAQATLLETWLKSVLEDYADYILDFTQVEAQVWGQLCVPQASNAVDKQIAATALTCGLNCGDSKHKGF